MQKNKDVHIFYIFKNVICIMFHSNLSNNLASKLTIAINHCAAVEQLSCNMVSTFIHL